MSLKKDKEFKSSSSSSSNFHTSHLFCEGICLSRFVTPEESPGLIPKSKEKVDSDEKYPVGNKNLLEDDPQEYTSLDG